MDTPYFTEDEVSEYLENVLGASEQHSPDFMLSCIPLLQAILRTEFFERELSFEKAMRPGPPENLRATAFVTGFCMGVEFERRRRDMQQLNGMLQK